MISAWWCRSAAVVVTVAGLAWLAPSVQAQSVNVDIQWANDTLYSGANGVLSSGGAYWNNSYTTASDLLDENGTATTVDLVLRQWLGSVSHSGSHALFSDGLTVGSSSSVIYDITGLNPYATYDVAVYYQNSGGDAFLSHASGAARATASLFNSQVLPGTENGEYLRFRSMAPYEMSAGVYGVKLYAYSKSGTDAIAGLQIKSTGSRANIAPRIPVLSSPADGATAVEVTPTLVASAFSDPDPQDAHANSRWQVDNLNTFASPEWDSGDAAAPTTAAAVPAGLLQPGTRYYWRVRYKDAAGNWSPMATAFSFTTATPETTTTSSSTTSSTTSSSTTTSTTTTSSSTTSSSTTTTTTTSSSSTTVSSTTSSSTSSSTTSTTSSTSSSTTAPRIGLSVTNMPLTVTQGQNPVLQSFKVWNAGKGVLNYRLATNVTWLAVGVTTNGTCTGSVTNSHVIRFSATALPVGISTGWVTVAATGAANSPQRLVVRLTVNASTTTTTSSTTSTTSTTTTSSTTTTTTAPQGLVLAPSPGSCRFDGDGDYLSLAPDAGFDFGTGDFTIDTRFKLSVPIPNDTHHVLYSRTDGGTDFMEVTLYRYAATGTTLPHVFGYRDGVNFNISSDMGLDLRTNTWYHIEVCRKNGVIQFFLDGVAKPLAGNLNPATDFRYSGDAVVGTQGAQYFHGDLDEFRISKGIARHTAAFTPPVAPYPADAYTTLLLHGDGLAGSTAVADSSAAARAVTAHGHAAIAKGGYFDALVVPEGGRATFTVRLARRPAGTTTATVVRSFGDTDVSVSAGASLVFTTANWEQPQVVTLAAAEDADFVDGSAIFTVSVAGLPSQTLKVVERDNEGLGGALDAPDLAWTTRGQAPWSSQSAVTHDGVDAARSGTVGNGQQSWLETDVEGPGLMTFWWKASSAPQVGLLALSVDQSEVLAPLSGETGWKEQQVAVGPGLHTFSWSYRTAGAAPAGAAAAGADAGFVDEVSWERADGYRTEATWDQGALTWTNGWRYLDWFGHYVDLDLADATGWIWHEYHDDLYVSPSSTPDSIWWWAQGVQWIWTSPTSYPSVYVSRFGLWFWYSEGTDEPRWFLNPQSGVWYSR